jgi:hypothetical protein
MTYMSSVLAADSAETIRKTTATIRMSLMVEMVACPNVGRRAPPGAVMAAPPTNLDGPATTERVNTQNPEPAPPEVSSGEIAPAETPEGLAARLARMAAERDHLAAEVDSLAYGRITGHPPPAADGCRMDQCEH